MVPLCVKVEVALARIYESGGDCQPCPWAESLLMHVRKIQSFWRARAKEQALCCQGCGEVICPLRTNTKTQRNTSMFCASCSANLQGLFDTRSSSTTFRVMEAVVEAGIVMVDLHSGEAGITMVDTPCSSPARTTAQRVSLAEAALGSTPEKFPARKPVSATSTSGESGSSSQLFADKARPIRIADALGEGPQREASSLSSHGCGTEHATCAFGSGAHLEDASASLWLLPLPLPMSDAMLGTSKEDAEAIGCSDPEKSFCPSDVPIANTVGADTDFHIDAQFSAGTQWQWELPVYIPSVQTDVLAACAANMGGWQSQVHRAGMYDSQALAAGMCEPWLHAANAFELEPVFDPMGFFQG